VRAAGDPGEAMREFLLVFTGVLLASLLTRCSGISAEGYVELGKLAVEQCHCPGGEYAVSMEPDSVTPDCGEWPFAPEWTVTYPEFTDSCQQPFKYNEGEAVLATGVVGYDEELDAFDGALNVDGCRYAVRIAKESK